MLSMKFWSRKNYTHTYQKKLYQITIKIFSKKLKKLCKMDLLIKKEAAFDLATP